MTLMNERHGQKREVDADSARIANRYLAGDSSTLPLTLTPVNSSAGAMHTVTIGNNSLTLPSPRTPSNVYLYSKRAGDVAAAAALLLVLFLPLMIVAVLIYLEDGGPIFYYQMRVGQGGKQFRFYKFRSMVRNADALKAQLEAQGKNEATGPIFKMENDPRITRIGRYLRRYSIDEMPQLMNVLKGEMSLIGPRPHLPREIEQYPNYPAERLAVQPGLLCFREVFGRSKMTFEEWLELDLLYIKYRSLRTDLCILMRTIPAVLKGEGAY
jgi:lipopolysaccharide/colanic/teichoic acid biosynthesis glycosyltransferase